LDKLEVLDLKVLELADLTLLKHPQDDGILQMSVFE